MSEDARLAIVLEAKIDKLSAQLSQGGQMIDRYATRAQRNLDELRAKIDPAAASAENLTRKVKQADDYLAAGKLSVTEHARAVSLAQAEHEEFARTLDKSGKAVGFNRMQMMELTHVARASFDAIAAGASPMRVLAMESGRVFQALSGGQGGLAGGLSALTGLFNPVVVGFLTIAAMLGAVALAEHVYAKEHNETLNVLRGTGAVSGLTIAQFDEIGRAAARAGGETLSMARGAEKAFVGIRGMTEANLTKASALVRDYAALTGQEAPKALEELQKYLPDAGKAAEFFNGKLHLLNAEQEEAIRRMDQSGDHAGALSRLLDALGGSSKGAADQLNAFGSKLNEIKTALIECVHWVGELAYRMTHELPVDQQLSDVEKQIADRRNGRVTVLPGIGVAGPPMDELEQRRGRLHRIADLHADIQKTFGLPQTATEKARSSEVADTVKALDPALAQIKKIEDQQRLLRDALVHKVPGQGSDADIRAAIAAGDRQIESLRKRGQGRDRHGPVDQTDTFDATVTRELDTANKQLIEATKTLTGDLQRRADFESAAVDADYQKQIDALNAEAIKIQKAKNDKNREAQLAIIEEAKLKSAYTAEIRKQKIQLDLEFALDQDRLRQKQEVARMGDQWYAAMISIARTMQARRDLTLKQFDGDRALERDALDSRLQDRVRRGELSPSGRAEQLAQFDETAGAERQVAQQRTMGPMAAFLDRAPHSFAEINDRLEELETHGLAGFNRGMADAIVNAQSLGDVAANVFKQMAADLIQTLLEAGEAKLLGGGIGGLLGFDSGGWTGSGAPHKVAGLVHQQEYVFDAASTRRIGVRNLEALRAGRLPGYLAGGLVGSPSLRALNALPSASSMATRTGFAPSVTFDMRGAVMTEDLVRQMEAIASDAENRATIKGAQLGQRNTLDKIRRTNVNRLGR